MVDLRLRARMMSPTMGLAPLLSLVIQRTHVGHVWLFKVSLLSVLWWLATGLWTSSRERRRRAVGLAAAAGLGLAQALSGHAADQGNITPAVLVDWLHVMATAAWFGGLIWLRLFLPGVGEAVAAEALRRFSRVAAACVGLLVVTGLATAFQQVARPEALLTTVYGKTLVLKVVLVAGMVGLGGVTRLYVIPGLTGLTKPGLLARLVGRRVTALFGETRGPALVRRGLFLIGLECLIGFVVLWCAAGLTQVPPPRAAMMLSPPHIH